MNEEKQEEKNESFELYLGKVVRILLVNNFTYTGTVLSLDSDTLTILDRFSQRVTFHLSSILIIGEVANGS